MPWRIITCIKCHTHFKGPHLFKQVPSLRVCKMRSAYLKYLSRTYVFIGRICGMGTVKYRTMMSCHVHGEDKFLLRL